jgi:hypothetical protein
VLIAEGTDFAQVAVVGNYDTGLALDGLDQEGCRVLSVYLQCLSQIINVVVADRLPRRWTRATELHVRTLVMVARARDQCLLFFHGSFRSLKTPGPRSAGSP